MSHRFGLAGLAGAVVTLAMASCAHRAPATIRERTAMISGHNTVHVSLANARQTVLIEAAAIAIDHGYCLFQLMTPIRPGSDVTIRVYGKGEIDPSLPNVYDANAIAAGQMPPTVLPSSR
jgi:hypothetical protein